MTVTIQPVASQMDRWRWIITTVLIAAAVAVNVHWAGKYLLLRLVGVVVLTAVAGWMAWNTAQGKNFAALLKEARDEAEKVVWPSRDETWQTTLIVLAVVVVMSLLLWMADSLFGWIIHAIVG